MSVSASSPASLSLSPTALSLPVLESFLCSVSSHWLSLSPPPVPSSVFVSPPLLRSQCRHLESYILYLYSIRISSPTPSLLCTPSLCPLYHYMERYKLHTDKAILNKLAESYCYSYERSGRSSPISLYLHDCLNCLISAHSAFDLYRLSPSQICSAILERNDEKSSKIYNNWKEKLKEQTFASEFAIVKEFNQLTADKNSQRRMRWLWPLAAFLILINLYLYHYVTIPARDKYYSTGNYLSSRGEVEGTEREELFPPEISSEESQNLLSPTNTPTAQL